MGTKFMSQDFAIVDADRVKRKRRTSYSDDFKRELI
jgi:hypothetical protein